MRGNKSGYLRRGIFVFAGVFSLALLFFLFLSIGGIYDPLNIGEALNRYWMKDRETPNVSGDEYDPATPNNGANSEGNDNNLADDSTKSSDKDDANKDNNANKDNANALVPPADRESNAQPIYFKAVGDIMLGRGVEYHLNNQGRDYTFPFREVVDVLKSGDIVFGNLEVPMTDSEHGLDPSGKYVIKSSKKAVESIKYAGFNVLNLANNHIMDYYEKGLLDTIDALEEYEIMYFGAGKNISEARKPAILTVKGIKIAFLGYTDMAEYVYKGDPMISFVAGEDKSGVAPRKYDLIKEDMEKIRDTVDLLVISLHWGVENSFEVTGEQREFAYKLIDDGADVILGHHPHRFQGVEIYKNKPIIYSLGNFIFDQNDKLNQESFIVDMVFTGNKLSSLELLPIRVIDKTHVTMPKGQSAMEMLNRELELCGKLGSRCAIVDDKIVFNIKSENSK